MLCGIGSVKTILLSKVVQQTGDDCRERSEQIQFKGMIWEMFKTGIAFLFGAFTHLIIIYIFGGYLYMKRLEVGGGVEGSIANQVPSILYIVFCIELLISIGFKYDKINLLN